MVKQYREFIAAFDTLQDEVYADAERRGFYDKNLDGFDLFIQLLSEVDECREGFKDVDNLDKHLPNYPSALVEMCDIVLTCISVAEHFNWPLGEVIVRKLLFNKER